MIPNSISTKELAALLNQDSEFSENHPDVQQYQNSMEFADCTYKALIESTLDLDLDLDAVLDRLLERIIDDQMKACDRMAELSRELNTQGLDHPDQGNWERDLKRWSEEKGKLQAMLAIWGTTQY